MFGLNFIEEPPAIVQRGYHDPSPPVPIGGYGPMFPSDESSLGCPQETHRVLAPYGMVICRISLNNTAVIPAGTSEESSILDWLESFHWVGNLVDQETRRYPEILGGTGTVKIITFDPLKQSSVLSGWGQLVRIGDEESAVVTTQHVMDNDRFIYLILNESGFIIRNGHQIVRVNAGVSSITEDSSLNLVKISKEEAKRLLPRGGAENMMTLGTYDRQSPIYMINTISSEFPHFTYPFIPVIVGEREPSTIIFMLKRPIDGPINNLCVGVSGTPIIQFVSNSTRNKVIVAFASSLPPIDISHSPMNPFLNRRCAPANTALRVPPNVLLRLKYNPNSIINDRLNNRQGYYRSPRF